MNDLNTRLQETLSASYRIERELGGGGMSRVFVAEDVSLGRKVVLKVLPPEMGAGVNAERFRREIQLAASLQHPHIVPLLNAGQSGDLVWYTMPLIEGESLRSRLARQGELPVSEAVRILRDVADALAYAHEHGVVHRDIKPDNVLISGHHGVVTDFGVAKAISAATGESSLTSVGVALGTPAYMAPEQASADPHVDHRADIYALGAMGYEMLTGQPPFAGPPQVVLAAHVTQAPEPVAARRPSVPPALAALIGRCLEKKAADRWQSAAELHSQLDQMATPSGGMTPTAATPAVERGAPRWYGVLVAILGLVVLAGVAALILWRRSAVSATVSVDPNVIAVLPFRVAGADPSVGYLREGMVDLLAAKLTGQGGPRASDPRSSVSAWRRAAGRDEVDLSEDAALRVGQELGAGQVLLGGVVGSPGRLVLNATVLEVPAGRTVARSTAEGPADSLPAMLDRLVASLLARGAGVVEQSEASLTTTSLDALRAYLDGQVSYRRGRFEEAARHFRRALQADSGFALAAMALATTVGWTGDPDGRRIQALAWSLREQLSARDQLILRAHLGPRYPSPSSGAEGLAARERAAEAIPDSPEAWYLVGDWYFHLGRKLGFLDGRERAAIAFRRALALDSTFGGALVHLVELVAERGDTTEMRRLAARYLRQDPASGLAASVKWRTAAALGDRRGLETLLAAPDSFGFGGWISIANNEGFDSISISYLERVLGNAQRAATTQTERAWVLGARLSASLNRGRREAAERLLDSLARVWPDSVLGYRLLNALYWDGDSSSAVAELGRLAPMVAAPVSPAAPERWRQYRAACAVERWRLRRGDAGTAERAISLLRGVAVPRDSAGVVLEAQLCAIGLEALGAQRRRAPDAAARIERLDSVLRSAPGGFPPLDGEYGWTLELARLLEGLGEIQRALGVVRRRVYWLTLPSPFYLSASLRHEGRLAAQAGDRPSAVAAYRWYLALRSDPEPALVPQRDSVRAELARLEARR